MRVKQAEKYFWHQICARICDQAARTISPQRDFITDLIYCMLCHRESPQPTRYSQALSYKGAYEKQLDLNIDSKPDEDDETELIQ